MKYTFFDSQSRYNIHPLFKIILTIMVMTMLPFLTKIKFIYIYIGVYIIILILFFRIRLRRFVMLAWYVLRGLIILFCLFFIFKSVLSEKFDINTLTNAIIFIEILIIGIIYANIITTHDGAILFKFYPNAWIFGYAWRSTLQLIEVLIDEIVVLRSRGTGIIKIFPLLVRKYLIYVISKSLLADENCCLKGSLPWSSQSDTQGK